MKIFNSKYSLKSLKCLTLLLMGLAGWTCCQENMIDNVSPNLKTEDGDKITLDVSLNMAEISSMSTRFSDTPDYNGLYLYVAEFTKGIDPLSGSNLKKIYKSEEGISDQGTKNDNNGQPDIHFKLTLDKTIEGRVLHFIAVPYENFTIPYGLEGEVIPNLTVEGETPAYWARKVFDGGYCDVKDGELVMKKDLDKEFEHIPMICNFAKITIESTATGANLKEGYEYDGFIVYNRPRKGYVAPYIAGNMTFPSFLNGSSLKSYTVIDKEYQGSYPELESEQTIPEFNIDPKYIYERTATTLYNPCVIVRVKKTVDNVEEYRYYKLDIGSTNDANIFSYYNILRNFNFNIKITKISGEGYATPQQALQGVTYNNVSYDVNLQSMLNVSDGQSMLWVNKSTIIVTQADSTEVTLKYRYLPLLENGSSYNNQIIRFKNLTWGEDEAIVSVSGVHMEGDEVVPDNVSDDSDGWRTITLTTATPTQTTKRQSFVVYNPATGIGRTINVVVRTPWNISSPSIWGGNYNYYAQFTAANADGVMYRNGWQNLVSSSTTTGQPLTVRFKIPDDLPEAIFPLTFTFEADNQNIEQNPVGDLLVSMGSSLFTGNNNTGSSIKYEKVVTWLDYNTNLTASNPNATIVPEETAPKHVVRGRFLTIAPITAGAVTTIRVSNPYFQYTSGSGTTAVTSNYVDLTFTGTQNSTAVAPYWSLNRDPSDGPDNVGSLVAPVGN